MFQQDRNKIKHAALLISLAIFLPIPLRHHLYANQKPSSISVTPSTGSNLCGRTITFKAVYSDPDGWKDIQSVSFLINYQPDAKDCVYLYYDRKANKLFLRNDPGTAWLGGFAPGANKVIQNSYVRLDCAKTTVSGFKATLAISWPLIFNAGFARKETRNIYLSVKDAAGAEDPWAQKGTRLVGINTKPHPSELSPAEGSGRCNEPVLFRTHFMDYNGWQDIQSGCLLINTERSGKNSFYACYDQNKDVFYLRNDADSKWLGYYQAGSQNIIENSYARLDCSRSGATGSDQTLIIYWGITFKEGFAGEKPKNCYVFVTDDSNLSNAWFNMGAFKLNLGQPPAIASISPAEDTVFLANAAIDIQVAASDPAGSALEYQFSINGQIRRPWSASNSFIWQTSSDDAGSADITCEVRNQEGEITSACLTYQIIDPCAEEIMQRLSDNYASLFDLSANMTSATTLNGQPFSQPEYCKYYFKAPDKEKTEAYSDDSRRVKNDVLIINGPLMHLFNPSEDIRQSIDLLAESGLEAAQFNQADFCYNQEGFLGRHSVARNMEGSDFNNMTVCLDAIPVAPITTYDKLEIAVDYAKGIISRLAVYKKNSQGELSLLQEMRSTAAQQMPNGVWVPTQMVKAPNLSAGTLITTLSLQDVRINTGLTDSDFDIDKQD